MGKKSRQKQQPKVAAAEKPLIQRDSLALVVFVSLCILLFYPPYFRAMFFTREQLPLHMLTFALFILWWIVKYRHKDSSFLSAPLDYCVFGLVLAYALSFTVAINTRGAIQEFLKVTNYFMVYWLVSRVNETKKETRIILNVLVYSALGVAILGLGAAAGTWEVAGGYKNGRIFSTIQYPNSLAAYLTGAFFVTLGLLQETGRKLLKRLYIATAFLLMLTTILTYSRGGWLLVPVFSVAYLVFVLKDKKAEAALVMGIVFMLAAALTPFLGRIYLAERGALAWLLVFCGTVTVLLLHYIVFDFTKKLRPAGIMAVLAVFLVLVLLAAGVYSYRALRQPLLLPAGPESAVSFEERLPVESGKEYTLSLELTAQAPGDQKDAWRIIVNGQKNDGNYESLINERGGDVDGWETKEFSFVIPDDIKKISVRAMNYTGTAVEVKDVVLSSENSHHQLNFTWNRLLPAVLYNRLFGMSVQEKNVQARFRYAADAWQIIRDHPILGLGGQGWKSRYFQYQSANYSSTEVHNHFLQVWVETGTIGFLLFLGIWLSFIHAFCKAFRQVKDSSQKILSVSITVAVLAVLTHSLYDFNLSLGAIGIFLWALLGVSRSLIQKPEKVATGSKWSPYINFIPISVVVILFVFVAFLQSGHTAYNNGNLFLRTGQVEQAASYFEQAVKYDRFNPEHHTALADSYEKLALQKQNISYMEKAGKHLQAAISLDRYHPRYSHLYGSYLIRGSDFDTGLEYLADTIALQPYLSTHYNVYARAALYAASYLHANNQETEAVYYINQVLPLAEQMTPYVEDTRPLSYALGQAHYMLGDLDKALEYLEVAYRVENDRANAAMVLSLIYEQKGNTAKARQYYDKALEWEPASADVYNSLKQI
jgi:tetratricopeptide (TPR) repeat protein